VGTGLAVALSASFRTVLVGPPGSGRGPALVETAGAYPGRALVTRAEPDDLPGGDACIVAVKAYDLRGVSRPAEASCDGVCVCVSNGMGLEEEWGPGWGSRVEPALLTAGFGRASRSVVSTTPGVVIVRAAGAALDLFSGGPIPVRETCDLESARWGKWLANSIVNPLGALTGLPNDRLRAAGLQPLIDRLARELETTVPPALRGEAAGIAAGMLEFLLSASGNICSMRQDVEAGRRTEIRHLTGFSARLDPAGRPAAAALTALVTALETARRDPRPAVRRDETGRPAPAGRPDFPDGPS